MLGNKTVTGRLIVKIAVGRGRIEAGGNSSQFSFLGRSIIKIRGFLSLPATFDKFCIF